MLTALLACVPLPGETSDTGTPDAGPQPAALAAVSAGSCPTVTEPGVVKLTANGVERKARVLFPADRPAGMPVVFAWHPLGASARDLVNYLDLDTWAEDNGVVVVAPDSAGSTFEWGFFGDATDDLTLYDDLRTCLSEQLDVDLRRVYATGMSAGGLWTSYLGMHRGDTLAALLPMSGGAEPVAPYATPAADFPALLAHGGETDTWGNSQFSVDFHETTMRFADDLVADGHFVVVCDHGGGHTFPPQPTDLMAEWLLPHAYGDASPYASGDLGALPSWCAVHAR